MKTEHVVIERLTTAPADAEAALVLADLWMGRGDVRGEVIALQHALVTAAPADVPGLEARSVEFVERHWTQLVDRPGGFPFSQRWSGRRFIGRAAARVRHYGPRTDRVDVLRRLRPFLDRFTDCVGPQSLVLLTPEARGMRTLADQDRFGFPMLEDRADALRELLPVSAHGTWDHTGRWESDDPDVPMLDALEQFLERHNAPAILDLPLKLTFPGTRIPLPFQHPNWYPRHLQPRSGLRVDLKGRSVGVAIAWPFEDLDSLSVYRSRVAAAVGDPLLFGARDDLRVY